MIPKIFIEQWSKSVSWQTLPMIEHDLIISKALVILFREPMVKRNLIFRGGTALNKIFLERAVRYSEDIDFVQRQPEPIGKTLSAIRSVLDPWLGIPRRKIAEHGAKLVYSYTAENGL